MIDSSLYPALKTNIQGQGTLAAAVAAADWFTVAAFYNAGSGVQVWLPVVSVDALKNAIDWTAAAGSGFQQLNQAQRDTYSALTQGSSVDATQANIRAGFASIFSASIATALALLSQRQGTRLEILFSVAGPPNVSNVFGQRLTADDVQKAMGG